MPASAPTPPSPSKKDTRRAAQQALDLFSDHLMKGNTAVAGGWFSTAQRLLADQPECPEHGRLAFIQAFYIQAARLMTIHCAEKMESLGDPRTDISAIKVFVPAAYERVVDRAIQVWGAAGVSGDLPLVGMYQGARTLRLADGPDEVHKILIAKNILKHYHAAEGLGWDFGN